MMEGETRRKDFRVLGGILDFLGKEGFETRDVVVVLSCARF